MYKILIFGCCLFLLSCGSTQTSPELKSYTSKNYSFKYPKTWKTYKRNANLRISPKFYLTPEAKSADNFISVFVVKLDEKNPMTIEEVVKHDVDVITAHAAKEDHIEFSSEWVTNKNGKLFILNVDNKKSKTPFEYLHHYFKNKHFIYILRYQVRQEGVNKYKNEALDILNSFKYLN